MTPSILARAAEMVQPSLRKAVASLDPRLRTPSEYHFGWVEPDGTPVGGTGGKGIRPALAVLGAEATGAEAEVAVPGAVAIELIHNFSLIHDDIMDGDRRRRHRRTVWDVYGVDDAIIVGDSLHTLAFEVLLGDADPLRIEAARRLAAATAAMIAGQAQDIALDRNPTATLAECLEMEGNKTGAILAQSVAIGAVLGGADGPTCASLERFGFQLGLSFQAIDDILGIWGDPEVTGKPAGNDLRERKKSMPVAVALDRGGSTARVVAEVYSGDMTDEAISVLAGRLEAAGIREEVSRVAREHLVAALGALDEHPLVESAAAELQELARFVIERDW